MKTPVRYRPFWMSDNLNDEINRFFGMNRNMKEDDESNVETSEWLPSVDIKEDAERFTILADIPGVDPKNIEVHMDNNVLTIKGEKLAEHKEEDKNYVRVERSSGVFYRRFSLPDGIDADGIKAQGNHGVLEITIPKHEKAKARKIEVNH